MPRPWHASAASIAYSAKITGSLYVKATLRHPFACAACAIASGDAASISVSISRDFEMSQFWQNLHARLQPAVPNDSTDLPGRERVCGLLSLGAPPNPPPP